MVASTGDKPDTNEQATKAAAVDHSTAALLRQDLKPPSSSDKTHDAPPPSVSGPPTDQGNANKQPADTKSGAGSTDHPVESAKNSDQTTADLFRADISLGNAAKDKPVNVLGGLGDPTSLNFDDGIYASTFSQGTAPLPTDQFQPVAAAGDPPVTVLKVHPGDADPADPAPPKGDPAPPKGDPAPPKGDPAPPKGDPAPPKGDAAPPKGDPAPPKGDPTEVAPTPGVPTDGSAPKPADAPKLTPEQQMLDANTTPEQKIAIADQMYKNGQKSFTGPDGHKYQITEANVGGRKLVGVFTNDAHGHSQTALRGIVEKDGQVSKQTDSKGNQVDYESNWSKKNDGAGLRNPAAAPDTGATKGPSDTKAVVAGPSDTKGVVAGPSDAKAVVAGPSDTKAVVAGPSDTKAVVAGPSDTKAVVAGPSDTKGVVAVPSDTKAVVAGPSDTKAVVAGPSDTKGVVAVPSDTKGVVAVPSDTKAVVAGPSDTKAVVAGPSDTKAVVAGPSDTKAVVAGPSDTKAAVAGPSDTIAVVAGPANTDGTGTHPKDGQVLNSDPPPVNLTGSSHSESSAAGSGSAGHDSPPVPKDALSGPSYDKSTAGAEPSKAAISPPESSAPISIDQFVQAGKQVLQKLSPDGSPVTKDQLGKAMQDPSYKGAQAQALAAMYEGFDRMHDLDKHEWIWNSKGLTAADLDKAAKITNDHADQVKSNFALNNWAADSMKNYADKDGVIHPSDIDKALNDPKVSSSDKEYLKQIQQLIPDIGSHYGSWFGEKGVKLSDLQTNSDKVWSKTDEAQLANNLTFDINRASAAESSTINHNLYATANPLESIRPDAISQGRIGDCYFEASLAAVARSNPEQIQNAIKDNGNGTYTVTFPGAKSEPITVKAPTDQELGLYNAGSKEGVWASVMEKAYGQYRDNHDWIGTSTPQDAADGGLDPAKAMKLLTGKDVATIDLTDKSTPAGPVAKQLEQAFSTNPPAVVTASSMVYWKGGYFTGGWDEEGSTPDGFISNHAFTITGFTPDGHGSGTVSLRNPWGGANGTTSGTMDIPLAEFMKNFQDFKMTKN